MQHPASRSIARPLAALLLLATLTVGTVGAAWAQTRPLNDTGIIHTGKFPSGTSGEWGDSPPLRCDPSTPPGIPDGQDCHYGRDAAARVGALSKTGGSSANEGSSNGFDYTKVCNSGELAGQGTCLASPILGAGANEWACVKDNVTGLIWEVKVNNSSHPRHMDHGYTWHDSTSPDGHSGNDGDTASCSNTLDGQNCNTENYVAKVRSMGLCGHADWRMPTASELYGLADLGRYSPSSIDPDYFPNTVPGPRAPDYWTGTTLAGQDKAWIVDFYYGALSANPHPHTALHPVRLVSDGH